MAVYFSSPANDSPTGYGRVATKLRQALSDSDIEITDKPHKSDIQIWYGQPFRDRKHAKSYRRRCNTFLTYTMFESTVLPDGWVDFINNREGLLTPSKWCANWFTKCGVKVPIDILHHGVDPKEFPFLERPVDRKYFTFIWQGVNPRDRKGCELVRTAFKKLRMKHARLIIKATPVKSPRLYLEYGGMKEIWDWYTQKQMLNLLKEADFSINPTSGEGFGNIPLEGAATGLGVAVTDFSGCKEYLDDLKPNMIGIKWKKKPSYFNSLGNDFGFDAAPQLDHICAIMEWANQNREKVREMGRQASKAVHKRWTWQRPINQLKKILSRYESL